nr:hypothetical protein [uncultured bacterium]
MKISVNLEDELLAKAARLSGVDQKSELLTKALQALISWESAKRLADLGGTEPQLKVPPRRRSAI